jgi:glycosyltransferase involved in cell wall biosynthesis
MTDGPLVSVIMNCFNGEAFLRDAIDSVIVQTYDRWEIIFWDNQSTDASAEIARSYGDSRIKYFRASTHAPLYEARNYAIAESAGDLIAFLDVDDWWAPTKLEHQVPLFDDLSVGLSSGNYWIEHTLRGSRFKAHNRTIPSGSVLDDLLKSYFVCMPTLVIRRTAFDGLEYGCDPRFSIIGDFDLVVRLATRWKLGFVQEPIAYYRLHGGNLSRVLRGRYIEEVEMWLGEVGQREPVRSSPGLDGLRNELQYSKALNQLFDGQRWRAFRLSRALPMGRFKTRLWASMLLPTSVVRWLKN